MVSVPGNPAGPDPRRVGRVVEVTGIVQAVGFRPFVYRLARELHLDGRVRNAAGRVEIEVAGPEPAINRLVDRIRAEAPPRARVEHVAVRALEVGPDGMPDEGSGFAIDGSAAGAATERLFPPDIATCDDCLRELADPADRRFRYPFINCTNCGPRATIIEDLPYDRASTSMRAFPLCAACEREYHDPADRRFHAEPVACPACGPRLSYLGRMADGSVRPVAEGEAALSAAIRDLEAGRIVAVKGLGGYHLAVDATNDEAVARLRDRKRRWAKPFAVMVRDLDVATRLAGIGRQEEALLVSPARPIVLLVSQADAALPLAPSVTAGAPTVGVFLPYTPLHHLLLAGVDRPLVLTSGNLADEPLVIDDEEALTRLDGVADTFLRHDRVIRARYDDSVTRVAAGRESIVRRARGYAPDPLDLPVPVPAPLLAVGAELKHTFTLAAGTRAYIGPHTGDLEDLRTHRAFEWNLDHLERLIAVEPAWVAHDLHPSYLSTQFAMAHFPPSARLPVQHHHAHVASCAAEHGIREPFIGVAYDGLGMGDDGTFWGGEILVADLVGYGRVGRFGRAPMPGGAMAVARPYRMALGYLLAAEQNPGEMRVPPSSPLPDPAAPFVGRLDPREVEIVRRQIQRRLNAPLASSAGRLFDAVASLLGIRDVAAYEAQAAIELEWAAARADERNVPGRDTPLPYAVTRVDGVLVYDPRPTLAAILAGLAGGDDRDLLAARFHRTIVDVTRELCDEVRRESSGDDAGSRRPLTLERVCLSGGVFQNRRLAESLIEELTRDGFEVFINRLVPVNDGGISYGQAAVAAARLASDRAARPVD
jgi:hydrogenase maturation protein HypF